MRIRIKFSKTGPLRYIGNLDLHTIWERTARRADLPLAYSHGFHPQPKIHIASPLPLGCSSRCELVELLLHEAVDLSAVAARLQDALPQGIQVLEVQNINPEAPAMQSILAAAEYEVTLPSDGDLQAFALRINELMESSTLPRARRGKAYDLRPLIEFLALKLDNSDGGPRLRMRLSAREGATGRPDEVLDALGISSEEALVERTDLIFQT